ncbi:MAG: hypothetical protein COV72_05755 [Candidatus Omnitrophica bacterium CG11_big_fil_rev_8_21_14_0_20_42_13]|uniref:Uncharacterized protein n=1 Tax=Candidatus Ghiorseimicrobium undicola TaxID=1974746 RepID=A0A2H0LX17_9BACT|nr:MAG: hypothetical protein COV72_05755 [Candidatus Omnitrophica bacterium CG11_big_fil_rev_8_21_14_0_20_42_13]
MLKLKGQSTLEYAMVTILVTMALLSMAIYLRNHIEGSCRDAADVFGEGRQYEFGSSEPFPQGSATKVYKNY